MIGDYEIEILDIFLDIFIGVPRTAPVHGHLRTIFCLLFHKMFSKLNIKVYFLSPFCILQTKISLRRQFKLYLLYEFFYFGRARACMPCYSHMRQNLRVPKKIYDNDLVFERGCHMSNLKREK